MHESANGKSNATDDAVHPQRAPIEQHDRICAVTRL
jgi:hypothetical protein